MHLRSCFILVLVHSSPAAVDRRSLIRSTWGLKGHLRHVLGRTPKARLSEEIYQVILDFVKL